MTNILIVQNLKKEINLLQKKLIQKQEHINEVNRYYKKKIKNLSREKHK